MTLLSHIQVAPFLTSRPGRQRAEVDPAGIEVDVSLDLNLTKTRLHLDPEGLHLPEGILGVHQLKRIVKDENACFLISHFEEENALILTKIQVYSEAYARFYSLFPTAGAPTMRVAGFPMHRIKDTDPYQDTLAKLTALGDPGGRVLDTTTGLGYTAIAAAKKAKEVITIEIDPTATEICRYNPWSAKLFEPPIDQLYGDAFEVIDTFPANRFDAVIHDPPTRQLAGELYSEEFYAKVLHVLNPGGRMFHYVGDPETPFGSSNTEGVIRRLRSAGFKKVERHPAAFGVVAISPR